MRTTSRLHCAVIAVAFLPCWPCWAFAQSSSPGNTATDVSAPASELGSVRVTPPVAPDLPAQQAGNATGAAETPLPPANLDADPIPGAVSAATTAGPSESPTVADQTSGPTTSSATAGIRAHTATEGLTRQQLADRASHQGGLGTDGVLMIVGGAAFIAGLIIGGGAGTAIAVAGAVLGLYGLYLYLR
jgi:hypothetical protein